MVQESSLHIYPMDNARAARSLRGQLQQRRAQLVEQIGAGIAADWADYKQRVGVIKGIDEAIIECDRIEEQERA